MNKLPKDYIRFQSYKHTVIIDEIAKATLKIKELEKRRNLLNRVLEERRNGRD